MQWGYWGGDQFCHAQQHQSKLVCWGKKFSFLFKKPQCHWFVRDSKLIACCEVGWVIYCLPTPTFSFYSILERPCSIKP